jgi:hypothetical protein
MNEVGNRRGAVSAIDYHIIEFIDIQVIIAGQYGRQVIIGKSFSTHFILNQYSALGPFLGINELSVFIGRNFPKLSGPSGCVNFWYLPW